MQVRRGTSVIEGFNRWLQTKKSLSKRSSKDVISRLLWVSRMVNIGNQEVSSDDVIHLLGKKKEFKDKQPNVRSHLRRSVRLFKQYYISYYKERNKSLF